MALRFLLFFLILQIQHHRSHLTGLHYFIFGALLISNQSDLRFKINLVNTTTFVSNRISVAATAIYQVNSISS